MIAICRVAHSFKDPIWPEHVKVPYSYPSPRTTHFPHNIVHGAQQHPSSFQNFQIYSSEFVLCSMTTLNHWIEMSTWCVELSFLGFPPCLTTECIHVALDKRQRESTHIWSVELKYRTRVTICRPP